MNMNQMNRMNQQEQARWPEIVPLYLPSIRTEEPPVNIYNNNLNFNDIDDIIYKLSLSIINNLNNYRLEQIKESNLYLYLYYYTQIKGTNKKRKIYNFIIKKIFNILESLINDNIFINNHNNLRIYTDWTEQERRDPLNLVHYSFNSLSYEIKNIIKYKLLNEFLYTRNFKEFETNIRHFSEPLGGAYIKFYNRTRIMDYEYKGRINCYIFNYENNINLNDLITINNNYINGLFYYLINFISYETLTEEEEEEQEEEEAGDFDFFNLSYNNDNPEEETEQKQAEKIKEIINKNYILINKTNLYYIDKNKDINNSFNYYKILQVKQNPKDPVACCLCLENDINIYRFQAVAGCSCHSLWCLNCLLYNSYKNNKIDICGFKCLICKNKYINYTKNLTYTNLLNIYYEKIKKDILYKMPYLINIIRDIKDKNKSIRYIKDMIKLHTYNMPDFSNILYNDIIRDINILDEFNKIIYIKDIKYKTFLLSENLLTKKKTINKRKLKKIENIILNKLIYYYNLVLINKYNIIINKIDIYNYQILKQEQQKRKKYKY